MKRLIPLLLVFLFLFAAACGNTPPSPAGTDSPAASAPPAPEPTPDARYVRWAVTEDYTWALTCTDLDYGWSALCLLGERDGQPILLYGCIAIQWYTQSRISHGCSGSNACSCLDRPVYYSKV